MLKHGLADGVATVTIANPPVNVLTIAMLREMAAAIRGSARAKVLLVNSEGDWFSAGVDVGEHREPHAAEMIASFRAVFDALMEFDGIAVAAFIHNWRFFMGYVEYVRGLRMLERDQFERGLALLDSAAGRVPEIPELAVIPNLLNAQLLIADDKNDEALELLARSRPHASPELQESFRQAELSAQMGIAFDARDYDALLAAARSLADAAPNEPAALASVASSLACKYADTGDESFRAQSLEHLELALAMAKERGDDLGNFEERVRHRLATRDIISRDEFAQRFPEGWKPEERQP